MFRAWKQLPLDTRNYEFSLMLVEPAHRHRLDLSRLVKGDETYLGVCLADCCTEPATKLELLRDMYTHFPNETIAWLDVYRKAAEHGDAPHMDAMPELTSGMLAARLGATSAAYGQLVEQGWWPPDTGATPATRAPRAELSFASLCAMVFTAAFKRLSEDAALLRLESVMLYHSGVEGMTLSVLEDVVGSREAAVFADEWREEHTAAVMHATELAVSSARLPAGLMSDWAVLLRSCCDPGVGAMLNTRTSWMAAVMLPWNAGILDALENAIQGKFGNQDLPRFGRDLYYVWAYVAYQRSRSCSEADAALDCDILLRYFPSSPEGYNNLSIDYMAVETLTYHAQRHPVIVAESKTLIELANVLQITTQRNADSDASARCQRRYKLTLDLWVHTVPAMLASPAICSRPDVVVDIIEVAAVTAWQTPCVEALCRYVPASTLWYAVDRLDSPPPPHVLQVLPARPPQTGRVLEDFITSSPIVHPALLCQSLTSLTASAGEFYAVNPKVYDAVVAACKAGALPATPLPREATRHINAWLLQTVRVVELECILRALRGNPVNPFTREPLTAFEFIEMQKWPFVQQKITEAYSKQ